MGSYSLIGAFSLAIHFQFCNRYKCVSWLSLRMDRHTERTVENYLGMCSGLLAVLGLMGTCLRRCQ